MAYEGADNGVGISWLGVYGVPSFRVCREIFPRSWRSTALFWGHMSLETQHYTQLYAIRLSNDTSQSTIFVH